MSEQGAELQTYNQELVKCIEDLKSKKECLSKIIREEETEKTLLEKNIVSLQEKLNKVYTRLQEYKSIFNKYDKIINDTENGFKKILESSQILLQVAQDEAYKLDSSTDDITHHLACNNKTNY